MPHSNNPRILTPGPGLSLSYNIIVKGHSGKLEVNTKEGEYTEFIVYLPL